MSSKVTHEGIIEAIDNRHISVRIIQQTACASCKIAAHCNASDTKVKIVDVYADSSHLTVGQKIVVSTSGSAVKNALLIGFLFPLFMIVFLIVFSKVLGKTDDIAALLALGSLIPYYIIVWLFRNKIAQKITFHIDDTK